MPLKALIAPIAAATVVTAFWFAAMWRGHRSEKRAGKPTWQYEAGLFGYIALIGAFAYFRADLTSSAGLDLFGIALASEGLGVVIVYTLLQAFVVTRGRPWSERAFPIVGSLFLAGLMAAAVLTA